MATARESIPVARQIHALNGVGVQRICFIDLHIIFLAAKLPQLRFDADIKAMAKIHHLFDP